MTAENDGLLRLEAAAQDLLFREARTANAFTDEPVSDAQIQAIYDLVKWAPTSFNQQPLRALLVRSAAARERLVKHMWDSNKDKTARAPLSVVLAADYNFHENLPEQFPVFPEAKDVVFADREVRETDAFLNGALQLGYFILGVRAAGLAAGPMTGADMEGLREEFFTDDHRVLAVVNIGKPAEDAWFSRLPRLEYGRVFTEV
ncbi:malonic semialdehyde reductase [Glycomyces sp. TRM65418]|uniref:malonic semialdehyde reductase n=1 Tax=Glycomyces sp. TRM65418 TaxID=2867006 RepID=UPI001CE708A5|nr:malonic semialdehyde reductase [Glycomyces sp. TRM65418]MCC3761585.1 malonic semialdehyde reductase [Glycomyces sp. TRM65418]QZD55680.1 malonic semialdehyde reductase [Glycomyces sp. TRM65418]